MAKGVGRVVLDTNVVVSAFWGGVPEQVVQAWFEGRYLLLISPPVLLEYKIVLDRLLPGSEATARFLHAVYLKAIAVEPQMTLDLVPEDPTDNRFLECAVEGRASYLVSGDRHLLKLKEFQGLRIVQPRTFLDLLEKSQR